MPNKFITAYCVDSTEGKHSGIPCQYLEVSECPSCHFAIVPEALSAFYVPAKSQDYGSYRLNLLSLCPHCRKIFMTEYEGCVPDSRYRFNSPRFSVPFVPHTSAFSDAIKALSPNFCETYSQSETAESHQLFQICGIGYRKALEYLVKDYLCHKFPECSDDIRSEFLGASIKRIEDSRIKTLAERSTWIGNDETHYVKKHEDLDVNDMKRFIKALLIYVESELAFEEALGIDSK